MGKKKKRQSAFSKTEKKERTVDDIIRESEKSFYPTKMFPPGHNDKILLIKEVKKLRKLVPPQKESSDEETAD